MQRRGTTTADTSATIAAPTPANVGAGTLTLSSPVTTSFTTTPIMLGSVSMFDPWENLFGSETRLNCEIPAVAFYVIGQCAWSWLIALLAGCFAAAMFAKRQKLQVIG